MGQLRFPALCYAVASSSPHINVAFTEALPVTKLLEIHEVGGWEDFLPFKRVWKSHWCVPAADSWCYSVSAAEEVERLLSHHAFLSNSSDCMSFFSTDGLPLKNGPGLFFFFYPRPAHHNQPTPIMGCSSVPRSDRPTRSSPGAPDGQSDTS